MAVGCRHSLRDRTEDAIMKKPRPSKHLDDSTRARWSPTASKLARYIVEQWRLSDSDASILLDLSGYPAGADTNLLTTDQLYRCGLLIEIYTAVHQLYEPSLAKDWFRRPNGALREKTPMQHVIEQGIFGLEELLQLLRARQQGH